MSVKDEARTNAIRVFASQFKLNVTALESHVLLYGVSQKITVEIEKSFTKHGITQGRFMAMALLLTAKTKSLKPSELAERAGVTRATMTGLLDTLEDATLVQRHTCIDDRRETTVELTAKGEALIRKYLPVHFKLVSQIMSGVSEKDRQSLASVCKKIDRNIERMDRRENEPEV